MTSNSSFLDQISSFYGMSSSPGGRFACYLMILLLSQRVWRRWEGLLCHSKTPSLVIVSLGWDRPAAVDKNE